MRKLAFAAAAALAIGVGAPAQAAINDGLVFPDVPYYAFDCDNTVPIDGGGPCTAGTNDSPFKDEDFSGGYFHFNDYEGNVIDLPGEGSTTTGSNPVLTPGSNPKFTDSVDEDNGEIDGHGQFCPGGPLCDEDDAGGHSVFNDPGNPGLFVAFDATGTDLCSLPTHVGWVWTDGNNTSFFRAWDDQDVLIVDISGVFNDGSFQGLTIEDRFFGVFNASGVSRIQMGNTS